MAKKKVSKKKAPAKKAVAKKKAAAKKQAHYNADFKARQRAIGLLELRGAECHADDKPYIEALIDIMNEKRRVAVEDSDIVFRIDNHGKFSVAAPDHVFVIVDRVRYRIPNSTRVIPAGGALIIRRGQVEELIKEQSG